MNVPGGLLRSVQTLSTGNGAAEGETLIVAANEWDSDKCGKGDVMYYKVRN